MNASPSAPPPALPMLAARPCLIVNPRSFRASRGGLAARAMALARRYGADVVAVSEPLPLQRALERLRGEGCARIFVLSGDGTVQAIVQYLALLPAGGWTPELLLLGGGRSNVTPKDVSGRGAALEKLEQALRRCRDGGAFASEERALLRIEQDDAPPQHGFFMAGAMIDAGIRHCRRHRMAGRTWAHTGALSTPVCLGLLSLQILLGRSPLPAYPSLRIVTDSGEMLHGPSRLLVATTLRYRNELYNPYASRGDGAVRFTAVSAAAPRFWRRLPRLLSGHFTQDMNLQDGYLSGGYRQVELSGLAGYSLDGEPFDADPSRPLRIRDGLRLRFLQP